MGQRNDRLETEALTGGFAGKRALFLANEDTHFWNHSRFLAEFMQARGACIYVLAGETRLRNKIERAGFSFTPWHIDRKNMNPLREQAAFSEALAVYRRVRPDYAHHLALKAILHGSLLAKLLRVRSLNHFSGLGQLFTEETRSAVLARRVLCMFLRFSFSGSRSIATFETRFDRDLFVRTGVVNERQAVLTKGVGVDTKAFQPAETKNEVPVVLLAGRYLQTKGVGQFAEAARLLKLRGVRARFVMAGQVDPANPASISSETVARWVAEGIVEDLGFRSDMPAVLKSSDILCFPSYYREGIPRILLEAGACELPVVATDIPGAREVIQHEKSGLIVPPRDPAALAGALGRLLDDAAMRSSFGSFGREMVTSQFDVKQVTEEISSLYAKSGCGSGSGGHRVALFSNEPNLIDSV